MTRIRIVTALGAAALVALAVAAPAGAHVELNPDDAAAGATVTIAFEVPNERTDASTTQLEILLPTDDPIPSVVPENTPGWQISTQKAQLPKPVKTDDGEVSEAVTSITYSGGSISGDQFQSFRVQMGPLPDVDQLEFKVVQTYSNGDVDRWIQSQPNGAPEPEKPAPVLTITKTDATTDNPGDTVDNKGDDDTARTIGWIAIVIGGVGVLIASVAVLRHSRAKSSSS